MLTFNIACAHLSNKRYSHNIGNTADYIPSCYIQYLSQPSFVFFHWSTHTKMKVLSVSSKNFPSCFCSDALTVKLQILMKVALQEVQTYWRHSAFEQWKQRWCWDSKGSFVFFHRPPKMGLKGKIPALAHKGEQIFRLFSSREKTEIIQFFFTNWPQDFGLLKKMKKCWVDILCKTALISTAYDLAIMLVFLMPVLEYSLVVQTVYQNE